MTDLPFHPTTRLQAIGIGRRGPIWPVMGGSQPLGALPEGTPPEGTPPANPGPQQQDPPDKGFPPNTPIKDMTPDQQAAYWKYHDRQKSNLLDKFQGITPEQALQWKQESEQRAREQQTPSERALEDARNEATASAAAAAAELWAPQLAESIVSQFVTDENARPAVMAGLNPMSFVKDGKFDKDALIGHLTGLAAAFGGATPPAGGGGQQQQPPRQWGQVGDQPPAPSATDYGLAEAERRGYVKK
ncbi:hypothetical protein [Mycolicibacterium porcinum]|uniref:hypothetical protein n=1 Tax=Mycolicibacterium porcinum TaxID=39693 RepID=UPI0010427911|nr:hypothetical protein [Mycolicibacterium porcinum]